ncbi:MAG: type II secretion system minor pseudopilin GspK [Pseudomonadota bacterium]
MTPQNNQRGAALLTVLIFIAIIAVLAVTMTDTLTRALGRASAGEARDQAFWALYGLEQAAIGYLEEQGEAIDQPGTPLFREPVTLPFEGGVATISFFERTNCFNINDLVDQGGEGSGPVKDEAAVARFGSLIVALGGTRSAADQVGGRIIDFIDDNQRAEPGGAEDYDYARRAVPYRTPGAPMASVSELRVIEGFSRDVYRSLAPFLCTLPTDGPQSLNVNTLTPAQAPLVVSIMGDALNLAQAVRLIDEAPDEGFGTVQEFLEQPLLQGLDLPSDTSTFFGTESRLLMMEMVLESPVGRLRQETLLERTSGGVVVRERWVGERLP